MANKAFIWPSGANVGFAGPGTIGAGCVCVVVDDSGNIVANTDPVQDNLSPYFGAPITSADTVGTIRANWLDQIQTMYGDSTLAADYMD